MTELVGSRSKSRHRFHSNRRILSEGRCEKVESAKPEERQWIVAFRAPPRGQALQLLSAENQASAMRTGSRGLRNFSPIVRKLNSSAVQIFYGKIFSERLPPDTVRSCQSLCTPSALTRKVN
jgi:hypothetical protein